MAAFVKFNSGKLSNISYEFHIGTGKSHQQDWWDVLSVQCDGDELDLAWRILGKSPNSFCVFTFIGAEAQQILANWR